MKWRIEVSVPTTAVIEVEAPTLDAACEKAMRESVFGQAKQDWQGAELSHATNLETGEETIL